MSKQQQHRRESFANSLCRDLGHDWMTTAASNYRVCQRERCRASQRLVDGQWVSNAQFYRFHDAVVEDGKRRRQPRQRSMWERAGRSYPLEERS